MPSIDDERRSYGFGKALAWAVLSSGLFLLTAAPVFWWPLAFLVPAPLAWMAIRTSSKRLALGATALAYIPVWLWLQRWLIDVTGIGYPLLAVYLSAYAVAFTWIIHTLARRRATRGWPMAVLLPLAWVGLEFVRGEIVFGGYAWFLAGQSLLECPILVQSADLFGAYGVSALVVGVAGAIVDGARRRIGLLAGRPFVATAASVVLLHAANVGYGGWRMGQTEMLHAGPAVLVVQTNLPQNNKIRWTVEHQLRDVAGFFALTEQAWTETGGDADLVVWPETMLPVRGLTVDAVALLERYGADHELEFARAAIALPGQLGVPFLVGSMHHEGLAVNEDRTRWTWDAYYNSATLIDPDGARQRYDKIHLTPFGEVIPYVSAWPWLQQRLLDVGAKGMSFTLAAADEPRRLTMRTSERELVLATPICFEDAVARVCRTMIYENGVKRANMIVNLSNDGWFGTQASGRMEHVRAAQFRCIENRVPMIRAANTGLSVSIDSLGRVVGTVGPGRYGEARQPGWLRAEVTLDTRRTVAGRIGESLPITCLLGLIGLLVWSRFSKGFSE